jgi:murein DD-endopeptidase MepM/ murein hydrolase activator NlpD
MNRPRKRYGYLGYPLVPERQLSWPRLVLAGLLLGALAFAGWQWLTRPAALPAPVAAAPGRPAARAQPPIGDAQPPLGTPVRPVVIAPTATISPSVTLTPTATSDNLLDPVSEVEPSWAERGGRAEIVTYTVQTGDTLWSIAAQYDLDVDTLRWSNPELERNPDMLSVGTELVILPVKGIYHTVEAGETLASIAKQFGVSEADILNYPLNQMSSPDRLLVDQKLVIPHGRKDVARPVPQPSGDNLFAWPIVGTVTQNFSAQHPALDIGAPYGSQVYAGRAGRVVRSAWARTGYGYTVIIDHGEGWQSLYSHMKGEWVSVGDWVEQGQLIGEVGSTGNSTGPHVHFEVRLNGKQVNPVEYLPSGGPR